MKLKYIKKIKGKILKIFSINKHKRTFKIKTLSGKITKKSHKYNHSLIRLTTLIGKEKINIKINTLNPAIIWTEIQ
ncbi:hypothetical protein JSR02_00295 [Candidatus Vidania fulgoroideae]|uniref:Uncharacterized protein n=1 Tax=Candidatus Vidania fulgoroideorum TaxID=881286 RepID=A0A975ADR6_9PROT|nr:hypothetical protein JSR02_00295 [Candidatus Vidania fulgoroideae]